LYLKNGGPKGRFFYFPKQFPLVPAGLFLYISLIMVKKAPKTKDISGLIKPEVRKLKAYSIEEASFRVKMDAMENPFSMPPEIQKEIVDAVGAALINRYPDPSAVKLKESIAALWGIGTKRMILGNGSDELIQAIILAFGGPVLIPTPTFAMYEITSRALAQEVVAVPLGRNFALDPEKMLKKAKETKARIIFLACPNNPTGNRFSEEAVLKIVAKANAAVVIDEAYFSFSRKSFLPFLRDHPNMIILRTLSKIGFAGLRIGILTASAKVIQELDKIRLPYNINTLSQAAAMIALKHPITLNQQISLLISARERLYTALSQLNGITVYPSEANFILFRTTTDATSIYDKLREAGILIKNLNKPGPLKNCLRVTVGTPEENSEFVATLAKLLK
jgi:histidinol-phosphate aminotransferase